MRTETGFNVTAVLKYITRGDTSKFLERCKSHSGGAASYEDEIYGEQSFFFQYENGSKKLKVEFVRMCDLSWPGDHEDMEDEFDQFWPSWQEYWAAMNETYYFDEERVKNLLNPTLFDEFT